MRALYLPFEPEELSAQLIIEDEKFHHLKVIRVKLGDEILLLNGRGDLVLTSVEKIDKKSISLSVQSKTKAKNRDDKVTVFLAVPKKDAFEDCVRFCVELGVSRLVPVLSRFSQFDSSHLKRTPKIIEASMEQSNNPFYLEITAPVSFEEALKMLVQFEYFCAFSSVSQEHADQQIPRPCGTKPIAVFIGPEAGFSDKEELKLSESGCSLLNLPVPIMRTPTALCVAIGHLLGLMK